MGDANKCYKCGKPGHWARFCHSKKREVANFISDKQESIKNKVTRCFICRKLGHLARECPSADGKYYDLDRPVEANRRNEETAPPPPSFSMDNHPYGEIDGTIISQAFDAIEEREWDFIRNESQKDSSVEMKRQSGSDNKLGGFIQGEESRYYKTVFLNETKFSAFVDTCSEKCLIKYSAAKKAHLNVQLDDTDVMVNSPTFKGKIVSIGKAVTLITVDGVEIANVEIFVVSDDVINIDVVIGRSWLDHPHILLLKIDNALYLADITVHPFDKFRSILNSLDIKPSGRKGIVDTRLDAVTSSDDEEIGKSSKLGNASKKRHHSRTRSDYKDVDDPIPRKHPREIYERERGRNTVRDRSRSRERGREPVRDGRMGKLSERSRRSRERSRDRYLSRHTGRP